jgi:hypothetical protein
MVGIVGFLNNVRAPGNDAAKSFLNAVHRQTVQYGALEHYEVLPDLSNYAYLNPTVLARQSCDNTEDQEQQLHIHRLQEQADNLALLAQTFDSGLGKALQEDEVHSSSKSDFERKRLVSDLAKAWGKFSCFCSNNPNQDSHFMNLGSAIDTLRKRLTRSNEEYNPLVKAANALRDIINKMAKLGLEDHNGKKVEAVSFNAA